VNRETSVKLAAVEFAGMPAVPRVDHYPGADDAPGPASRPAAVEADGLTVSRGGVEVLHRSSFTIATGRVTGLLGPSGSGKTTLMRALVGVQRNVSGTLRVLGVEAGQPSLRRRIAYLTQAPSVYGDLTIRENLDYFASILAVGAADVENVLERVELSALAGRAVRRLSGGEQARVSLASALLGGPKVLVLDEPTVGLDPVLRRHLWKLFGELAAGGATLLVSSHVMDEARRCDELLLLRDGWLIARDTPAELARRTGTDDLDEAFLRLVQDGASR
jgi:ABC-2 type transport system ATP-binding protein